MRIDYDTFTQNPISITMYKKLGYKTEVMQTGAKAVLN